MARKGMRIVITGKPRPVVDVLAMTRIIIALGRELAAREHGQADCAATGSEVTVP